MLEIAAILSGLARAQTAVYEVYRAQEAIDTVRRAFDAFVELADIDNAVAVATHPHGLLGFSVGTAEMTERALDLVANDSLEMGYLLVRHGAARIVENKDYIGAQNNLVRAAEIARHEGDLVLEVSALARIVNSHMHQGHWPEVIDKSPSVIELAQSLDELHTLVLARFMCALAFTFVGNGSEAQLHATAGTETAERLHNRSRLTQLLNRKSQIAILKGEWAAAQESIARALAESPRDAVSRANSALLHYNLGDPKEYDEFVERILELMPEVPSGLGWEHGYSAAIIPLFGRVSGKTGQYDVAESAANAILSWQSAEFYCTRLARVGLGLMAVQQKDTEVTTEQYSFLEPHTRGVLAFEGFCGDRLLGLLAQTMGNLDDAQTHFDDALTFCRNAGYRPELAWSLCDYADMLLERNDGGDLQKATALLDESLALSSDLGMRPLMERLLSRKVSLQGIDVSSPQTSIDAVVSAVEVERPNLQPHAAPDGTVTVMFTDIEGSTAMTERLGDQKAQDILRIHNAIIREQVAAHQGFEVKSAGDGFMLAFSSARKALECAIAIQQTLAAHNAENPAEPIRVRIGLHTGEAIKEGEDFFGKSVILAARIASQAVGGEILVSSLLKALVESSGKFEFGGVREAELKGLTGVHQVHKVTWGVPTAP